MFVSLIFWGWILGGIGAFLAVPLTLFVHPILLKRKKTPGKRYTTRPDETIGYEAAEKMDTGPHGPSMTRRYTGIFQESNPPSASRWQPDVLICHRQRQRSSLPELRRRNCTKYQKRTSRVHYPSPSQGSYFPTCTPIIHYCLPRSEREGNFFLH